MPRKIGPQLTREDIVQAAAALLAREGYDGLTMRGVAAELGVQAPALYWHVKNKEDLSLLLFDHLIADIDLGPPADDWREELRAMAERMRRRLVETRDIARLFPDDYAGGPRAALPMERSLGVLRRAGLGPQEALYAYGAALSFIVGWARFEAAALRRGSAGENPSPPPEVFPNIAWAAASGGFDRDAAFRFGVDLMIAGLELRLSNRP